jgi:foldase protein PrsA
MFKRTRYASILGLILVGASAVVGCGSNGHARAAAVEAPAAFVARVGATTITQATLDHWTSVLAPGPEVPDPPSYSACVAREETTTLASESSSRPSKTVLRVRCQQQYRALEQHALSFLISGGWLIDEAVDRRVGISSRDVDRRFNQKTRESFPNGQMEAQEFLRQTGQTVSDVKFRVLVELAASRLRRLLAHAEPRITEAQIVAYYKANEHRFVVPERRYVEFIERTKLAAAEKAKREIEGGRPITSMEPLDELIVRFARAGNPAGEHIERRIFSPKLNVLTGPIKLFQSYAVFVVTRITPTRLRTLAQVRHLIQRRLLAEERQRTVARFAQAWTKKWTAKTDCQPQYVVQQCRQHGDANVTAPQDPFALG